MRMRREFKGPASMGGWLQFVAPILSLASGWLGRKDAKDAREDASKPIPTEQNIQDTTTRTAPDWLLEWLQSDLFPRMSGVGELFKEIPGNVGQFAMSPYMGNAAQGMQNWMNSPFFAGAMNQGAGAMGSLFGGMNPAMQTSMQYNPILSQALEGMLGVGQNNPMAYGSQLQNNLQAFFDRAFSFDTGGLPGGRGLGYNSNMNTTPSNPGDQMPYMRQYLDMVGSGRDDFLSPWGYGRGPTVPVEQARANSGVLDMIFGNQSRPKSSNEGAGRSQKGQQGGRR